MLSFSHMWLSCNPPSSPFFTCNYHGTHTNYTFFPPGWLLISGLCHRPPSVEGSDMYTNCGFWWWIWEGDGMGLGGKACLGLKLGIGEIELLGAIVGKGYGGGDKFWFGLENVGGVGSKASNVLADHVLKLLEYAWLNIELPVKVLTYLMLHLVRVCTKSKTKQWDGKFLVWSMKWCRILFLPSLGCSCHHTTMPSIPLAWHGICSPNSVTLTGQDCDFEWAKND